MIQNRKKRDDIMMKYEVIVETDSYQQAKKMKNFVREQYGIAVETFSNKEDVEKYEIVIESGSYPQIMDIKHDVQVKYGNIVQTFHIKDEAQ